MTDVEDIKLGIEVCQKHELPVPLSDTELNRSIVKGKVISRWLTEFNLIVIVFDDGTSVSVASTEGECLEIIDPQYNRYYWNWLSYFNSIESVYPLSVQLAKKEYLDRRTEKALAKRKEQDFKR